MHQAWRAPTAFPLSQDIQDAMATGVEWLGSDHPAVQCLKYGIALHHGRLPRPFLNDVERLLRLGKIPLTIASPTLAQGLNLSASVLLVPSIWREKMIIPASEFANVRDVLVVRSSIWKVLFCISYGKKTRKNYLRDCASGMVSSLNQKLRHI